MGTIINLKKINLPKVQKFAPLNNSNTRNIINSVDHSAVTPVNNYGEKFSTEQFSFDEKSSSQSYTEQFLQINSLLDSSIKEIETEIESLNANKYTITGNSADSIQLVYNSSNDEYINSLNEQLSTLKYYKKQIQTQLKLAPYQEILNSSNYNNFINNYNSENVIEDVNDLIDCGYDVNLYYMNHINSSSNINNTDSLDQYAVFELMVKNNPNANIETIQAMGNASLMNGIGPDGTNYSNPAENYYFMTDEQRGIYHYLFKTKGKQDAEDYITLIQDEINMRAGAYYANKFISTLDLSNQEVAKERLLDYFKVGGKGLIDGVDSFFTGLNNSIIANEQLESGDYEKMYILEYLRDNCNILDENYEFSQAMGNMIPAMTTSAVISCISTPAAGSMVGSALMGLSAEGNSYRQAKIEGHDELSSRAYGVMVGSSEALLGYFLGKIPSISKASGFTLKNLFMEGAEEFSQEWIDAGLQAVILGKDVDWSKVPENATKSFIMGIMMAGLTNGGSAIINTNGKKISVDVYKTLECIEEYPEMDIMDSFLIANADANTESLLQRIYENGGKYGIDQGVLTNLMSEDPVYYGKLKIKMIEEYGFIESDIPRIFYMIDTAGGGACPYARSANVIFEYFKNKPAQFEQLFGFPLYRQTSDGNVAINDAELLLDIYYWGNAVNEEGQIFGTAKDGKLYLKDPNQWIGPNGRHYFPQRGSGYLVLANYLKYKSDNISIETESFFDNMTGQNQFSLEEIKSNLQSRLDSGESLSMGLCPINGTSIEFTNINNPSEQVAVGGGHWVKIVDTTEEGIIVSSWGRKCLIKYEDLTSGNVAYNLISDDITVSE